MIKLLRFYFPAILFALLIHVSAFAQNCTINAGADRSICPGSAFVLTGNATGLLTQQATWTQTAGQPVTVSATTVNSGTATATVTGYAVGQSYTFRLSATCTDGSPVFDDAVYTVSPLTVSNAGPDIVSCPGPNAVTMAANALKPGETGVWSVNGNLPLPNPVTSPTGTITLPATGNTVGTSVYTWTITSASGSCSTTSSMKVTNLGGEPISVVTPVNVSCYSIKAAVGLHASFGGSGNGQIGTWSFISGPSTPTFGDIHDQNTGIGDLIGGTYVVRWTVTGPCFNGSKDVTVNVSPPSQDVTNAGGEPFFTYCDGRTNTALNGVKPLYKNEVVSWVSASTNPGGVVISNPTSPTTTISGLDGASAYDFVYTITNTVTNCSSVGIYHVRYTTAPFVGFITANPSILPCNATQLTVNYTVAGGNRSQWALVSAPPGSQLQANAGINSFTTAADNFQPIVGMNKIGTYVIRFRRYSDDASGGCNDAFADITIVVSKAPYQANAGTSQFLSCNTTTATLAGNAPQGDDAGTGQWSQVSGPNTATIANKALNTTGISNLQSGVYVFRWIVTGGSTDCGDSQSDVKVIVATAPTHVNAGADMSVCYATPTKLAADPPALNEKGTWSVVSESPATPASTVTFSSVNDPNAIVTGLLANKVYTLQWKIENSCGSITDQVVINTNNTNGPKQANAGTDQCLGTGSTIFNLSANAPGTGETGIWTLLPGSPNTPAFTNASSQTVTGATIGTYQFEWQLSKGGCTTTRDTVVITISAATTVAAINGNIGTSQQDICGLGPITLTATNAALTAGEVGTWTQTGGPGGVVITSPNAASTTVTGLIQGRYKFTYTITNGACSSSSAEITYNLSTPPTPAIAAVSGTNPIALCDATSTVLDANTITVGTGLWVVQSGPNAPTFSSLSDPHATISGLQLGTYVLTWQSTNGIICPASTSNVTIIVHQSANAGADQALCNTTTTILSGNEGSDGTWTMVSALPAGTPAVTITKNGSSTGFGNTAIVTGLTPNANYVFRYTINTGNVGGKDAGGCGTLTDDMTVAVSGPPSTADAGPDQQLCTSTGTSVTLAAVTPTVGTGSWNIISRPIGSLATLSSTTDPHATLDNLSVEGDYLLQWTVTNANCTGDESSNDIVRISVFAPPTVAAPITDQPAACLGNVTLTGTAPTIGIGTWTFVPNGPGDTRAPVIDAINSPTTTVSGLVVDPANPYKFRWTITNGICSASSADVNITVKDNTPTVANAGAVTNTCATNAGGTASVNLASTNTTLTGNDQGTWTVVTQPPFSPAVTFNNLHSAAAIASGLKAGAYTLRWTIANNSACTSTSDVSFTIFDPPSTADAGPPAANYCLSSPAVLSASAPTSGTGTWTVLSKPVGAADPVFSSVNDNHASVSGLVAGVYTFRWTVSTGQCTDSHDDITITVANCIIDLGITITDGKQTYLPGTTNTYTVVATNKGTSDANGATVTLPFPTGITGTWIATYTGGGSGSTNGANSINEVVNLPVGATVTYTVTAAIASNFTGDLTMPATITPPAGLTDGSPTDNSASDTDNPINTDLKIVKTASTLTPSIGTQVTFTLLATNNGPSAATNVNVSDLLPSGFALVSATADIGTYNSTTGLWTIGNLANAGSANLTVITKVNATGGFTNIATITGAETDNNPANNSSQVTITPRQLPLANNDAATTGSNAPVAINLLNNDVKAADNLVPSTVTVITQPQHGTVTINPATGIATYTPTADYVGTDTFTYTVTDANGGTSNIATATITVDKAPVANNDSAITPVNTPVTINLPVNDANGDAALAPSTVTIVQQPLHGTVTVNPANGVATYTPNPGYFGQDNFTYTIKDQNGSLSNVANVTILIPQGPTAVDDNATTTPNKPVGVPVINNDKPGSYDLDPTTVTIIIQPAHGTLIVDPVTGLVTYTPALNYAGPDQFTYTIKDKSGAVSNVATVNLNTNDKPVIGLAKSVQSAVKAVNGSYDVTYILTVGNYGITDLNNISIKDNLAATFGGEQWQVKSIRTLGRLSVNNSYNGNGNTEMLASGNQLFVGQVEEIELVVSVTVLSSGNTYLNRATASGTSITGASTTDQSTDGLKPDVTATGDVSSSIPTPVDLKRPNGFIPQGFSPNGDGVHDTFVIENVSGRRIYLEVYNRWGNLVYRNNDYRNDWGGKCNQGIHIGDDLPEGTYYYIVKFDDTDRYVGYITLNR